MKTMSRQMLSVKNEVREFQRVGIEVVNNDARQIRFSGSSGYPVERYDYGANRKYIEILSHEPADVDLSHVRNGGAVLDSHYGDQIGVVEDVEIRDGKTVVTARFSSATERANAIYKDIVDGIRRNISVGYIKTRVCSKDVAEGKDRIRFAWRPYEFSVVTVPADPTVGVGRGRENESAVRTLEYEDNAEETKIKLVILT